MCADQPAVRAQANTGVNSSGGTPAWSSTTADQNSTLVASTRSGLRARSSRGLQVDPWVGGADGQRVRLGGRQARLEPPVHKQAPHALERDRADELLDVDTAVAERAALPIGLGDTRVERHHAFESAHRALSLYRRALAWFPHSAIEHQRRAAAGERS
jgi:hypothetical protein